jgi:hypothetical protein
MAAVTMPTTQCEGLPHALDRHAIMKLCLFTDKLSDSPGGQEDAAKN